jgi:hypothetical protein
LARWYADPSGWWRDPELLHDLVGALAELHRDAEPNAVVGIASRGMQVGPLVAQRLKIGFVEIRKDLSQHLHHRPTFFGAATHPTTPSETSSCQRDEASLHLATGSFSSMTGSKPALRRKQPHVLSKTAAVRSLAPQ